MKEEVREGAPVAHHLVRLRTYCGGLGLFAVS